MSRWMQSWTGLCCHLHLCRSRLPDSSLEQATPVVTLALCSQPVTYTPHYPGCLLWAPTWPDLSDATLQLQNILVNPCLSAEEVLHWSQDPQFSPNSPPTQLIHDDESSVASVSVHSSLFPQSQPQTQGDGHIKLCSVTTVEKLA